MHMAFITIGIMAVLVGASYAINTVQQLKYPKILWIYWDSEEMPDTIKQIRNYNRARISGYVYI